MPQQDPGRRLELLYQQVVERESLFGIEVIEAIVAAGLSLYTVGPKIGVGATTFRTMLLRESATEKTGDMMNRLLKLEQVINIPAPRLFALFFHNCEEHALATTAYIEHVYHNISHKDQALLMGMLRSLLENRDYTELVSQAPRRDQYPYEAEQFLTLARRWNKSVQVAVKNPQWTEPMNFFVDYAFGSMHSGAVHIELQGHNTHTGELSVGLTLPVALFPETATTREK